MPKQFKSAVETVINKNVSLLSSDAPLSLEEIFKEPDDDYRLIVVNPNDCINWRYSDRSKFELGNIDALAKDLSENGQHEPVTIRLYDGDKRIKYEIIAGERRWRAAKKANIQLKAILRKLPTEVAVIVQKKENEKEGISDYSQGMLYHKLITDGISTQDELQHQLEISSGHMSNLLSFASVPSDIWDEVNDLKLVSARTSACIRAFANKGNKYIKVLVQLAHHIQAGAGSRQITHLVTKKLAPKKKAKTIIKSSQGKPLFEWQKTGIRFDPKINDLIISNKKKIEIEIRNILEKYT